MDMYYVMIEAVALNNNDESELYGGAFINCWTKAETKNMAIDIAKEYINEQGWEIVNIEEISKVSREKYLDSIEILEVYDEACECGVAAIIYTWPISTE
ncbi:MAG: hypothetical protein Q4D51_02155 [Eubacteriales bacterium]|nr:hypothetical protein [Eubacteriales bacterium]